MSSLEYTPHVKELSFQNHRSTFLPRTSKKTVFVLLCHSNKPIVHCNTTQIHLKKQKQRNLNHKELFSLEGIVSVQMLKVVLELVAIYFLLQLIINWFWLPMSILLKIDCVEQEEKQNVQKVWENFSLRLAKNIPQLLYKQ